MYNLQTVAAALGVSPRQFDNFARRYLGDLVATTRRGSSRSVPHEAVELAAVALIIMRDLGSRPDTAVKLASGLLRSETHEVSAGTLTTLRFGVPRLRQVLAQSLADAVEFTAPSRRGRPPLASRQKKKRGAPEEAPRFGW